VAEREKEERYQLIKEKKDVEEIGTRREIDSF